MTVGLAAVAYTATLSLEQTISLPNVEGRIDHFAHDAAHHRLFVAALGNNSVEIIDLMPPAGTNSCVRYHLGPRDREGRS